MLSKGPSSEQLRSLIPNAMEPESPNILCLDPLGSVGPFGSYASCGRGPVPEILVPHASSCLSKTFACMLQQDHWNPCSFNASGRLVIGC